MVHLISAKLKYTFIVASLLLMGVSAENRAFAQCPISNACTPGNASNGQAGLFGGGIFEVKLGASFTNTTLGATDGYKDYCSLGTTSIPIGSPISFSVKTGTSFTENLRVYLDINNDQSFNPTTELVFSSNNAKIHAGNLLIPSGTTGQVLKLRITTDLINSTALPGPCTTPEFSQVEDYAVTLVENVIPPLARFAFSDSVTCSGTIVFTDQSLNNPTTWLWNFGDGDTSTQQNPTHHYNLSGTFSVKLKVTSVHGVDSLTKLNLIYYNDTVARAPSCQPVTINQCCGYGISRVVLNTIDNSSALGSYQDFSCSQRTVLLQGRTYQLQLGTNPNQNQDTKAWIDYNDNGQFEDTEEVFNVLNAKNPAGMIMISNDTAVKKNKPIRFRVMSEYSGGTVTPCAFLDRGQTEDYTVTIKENLLPPVADFSINTANFCLPTFSFSSLSVNVISEYHWFFGDGTDSITTQPTVSHTYSGFGTYDPKLVVTGPYGVDSTTKLSGVFYYGAPSNTCTLNTQQGGPNFGIGIAEVSFGTIKNRTGDAQDGYKNYSCTAQTVVKVGQNITLTVRNSSENNEKVKAWIDWNGNGTFETSELVMNSQADTVHTVVITIPGTAQLNQTLKLRVASNAQQAGAITTNGCGTIQVGQAEDYGVVVIVNTAKPVTNFGANQVVTCTGVIQFTDSSENLPNFYHWDFGDGDTSSLASPIHTYQNTGTYTVSLIAANPYGVDTLTRPSYINVTQLSGMVPAVCTPANSNNCCQYGIEEFSFAGIDNFSGDGSEGNKDFSCTNIAHDTLGKTVNVFIQNSGTNQENVAVWIDWNNDGTFADAEKAFSGANSTSHSGSILIPTTAPVNVGLRIRVKSDFVNAPIGSACAAPTFGQFEDYQIILAGNNQTPVAHFGTSTPVSCFSSIQFADSSNNAPTSWKWYFGDGDSSDVRNPLHVYPGPGSYSVKLISSNVNGSDTLERLNYITINDGQNLKPAPCTPQTVNVVNNPGMGITQVTFNTINVASGTAPAETYVDRACLNKTTVIAGASYVLTVKTSLNFNESCRAWIDWNNDGQFTDPAERVLNGANARTHTATFAIPATAKKDTALRMRILSDFIQGPGGDLQPCNPPTFGQCEDYGVVVIVNTQPPVAKISSASKTSCNGFITFKDSTLNAPTSWLWSFGDNTTSPLQNPVHQYLASGLYTVKLKVTNNIGIDSVEIPNYINITGLNGPKPASCIGITSAPSANHGTTRVRLANLDKTSSFSAVDGGYVDYSCGDSAIVNVTATGQTFPIIINTSNPPTRENCRVYIDFNNNGTFDATEQVLGSNNNNTHTGNLTGTQARCLGLPVRMRVITDNTFNNITNACYNPNQGQVEDYMIKLNWITANTPQELARQIELVPNPASDVCTIQLPDALKGSEIRVMDVQGKLVFVQKPSGNLENIQFSTTAFPNGVYRILIPSGFGMVVKPLIIQH